MKKLKIAALQLDPKNANLGTDAGRDALAASLENYGAGRSILIDKKGRVIAGNKTVEQARAAGHKDVLVIQTDGSRLVAVQRTDLDLDSATAQALAIADNRVGEMDLNWDVEALAALEKKVDLSDFWDADAMDKLLGRGGKKKSTTKFTHVCPKCGHEFGGSDKNAKSKRAPGRRRRTA
jgi:ParB-like chromosome segregation protein Spo0J